MKKSESVKNIAQALAKFRKGIRQPLKDADNPFFKSKYVPLENVVEAIDEVGAPLGLSFIQEATSNEQGMVGVATTIFHESGEWIEFEPLFLKPEKANAQGYGSSVTYARRYSLSSAFGITSDMDDDGNEASGNRKGKTNQTKAPTQAELEKEANNRIKKLYDQIKAKNDKMTDEKINQTLKGILKVEDLKGINKGLIIKTLEQAVDSLGG